MTGIDFIAIYHRFHDTLTPGQRAEIRRARTPDELALLPAFYRLLPGIKTDVRWQRVIAMLPYVRHMDEPQHPLGEQLARSGISEKRLFQVIRSHPPNDLVQFRRLLQQVEPVANWQRFGESLYYWNKRQKRNLAEEFFLTPSE